jgi:hypothetical protein
MTAYLLQEQAVGGSGVHWGGGQNDPALVLRGSHPRSTLDPNRHGVRAVNAAGGSVTKVTVRFTARPVIVPA